MVNQQIWMNSEDIQMKCVVTNYHAVSASENRFIGCFHGEVAWFREAVPVVVHHDSKNNTRIVFDASKHFL